MDTLTHALTGALAGRAIAGAAPRRVSVRAATLTGAGAAAFPDTDFVLGAFDQLAYLELHQALTHSLPMMPVWAWLLALAAARIHGRNSTAFDFLPITATALLFHTAADVCNIWGLALLWPFTDARAAFDAIFVIDPVYTSLVVVGLVLSMFWRVRAGAVAGIAAVVAYTAAAFIVDDHADRVAVALPQVAPAQAFTQHAVPLTLAQRRVVVATGEGWRYAYFDLSIDRTRPPGEGWVGRYLGAFPPPEAVEWRDALHPDHAGAFVAAAWHRPGLAQFRGFVELPYVHAVETDDAGMCAWFSDLRFTLPEVAQPFVWGACRDAAGAWTIHQRGRW